MDNTIASYIIAITSILARIPQFNKEYEYISPMNNQYAALYQNKRDTNDTSDEILNKMIPFDDTYINDVINKIDDINDKALFSIYTLANPVRLKEVYLMKIANFNMNYDELDKEYNYLLLKNDKPFELVYYNFKTKKNYENNIIKISKQLSQILDQYIIQNKINAGDYLFFDKNKEHYNQSAFSKKLQKLFFKYTGKNISVDLIRASKATSLESQNISLAERKKISNSMNHYLTTNLEYSKHMGILRLSTNLSKCF